MAGPGKTYFWSKINTLKDKTPRLQTKQNHKNLMGFLQPKKTQHLRDNLWKWKITECFSQREAIKEIAWSPKAKLINSLKNSVQCLMFGQNICILCQLGGRGDVKHFQNSAGRKKNTTPPSP